MVNQVSSLLIRHFQTVYHQKANIACNIITPIMCLFFIWIVKAIVQEEITKTRFSVKLDIPIIFNVPIYNKLKYSNLTAKTTSCEEWYLYDTALAIHGLTLSRQCLMVMPFGKPSTKPLKWRSLKTWEHAPLFLFRRAGHS